MKPRTLWLTWLQVVLGLVLAYALVLVFAGSMVGSLFGAFGFGPSEPLRSAGIDDYLRFPFMVLGAVLAGWTVLLMQVVRGPLRRGEDWAWFAVASSLALWFVLDTAMSFVLGFPTHALFNVPFAVALTIPIVALRVGGR